MSSDEVVIVYEPAHDVSVSTSTPTVITTAPDTQEIVHEPQLDVEVSIPGIQGPPGPPGPTGEPGGVGYEHVQSTPSATWGPIIHGLNKYPDVSVWIDNELTEGVRVEFVDLNTVNIYLNVPKPGRARFQ
jgi:hypothetical protein